jgi:hypothetical protein
MLLRGGLHGTVDERQVSQAGSYELRNLEGIPDPQGWKLGRNLAYSGQLAINNPPDEVTPGRRVGIDSASTEDESPVKSPERDGIT